MKVLYLDESGEHNPSVTSSSYPIFVLGGIIADKDYADGPLTDALNDFKRPLPGAVDIILHTADITRNRNGFEFLMDPHLRNRFYERLNGLMRELQYSAVACAIHKDAPNFSRFSARDLYLVCFEAIAELFCQEVGDVRDGGIIIAESRGTPPLNRALERHWSNLRTDGAGRTPGKVIADRILAFNLRAKADNIAGLQMADLVVSPIGRHLLGKQDFEDWRIVEDKLRRDGSGQTAGHGLIVLE